MDPQPGVLSVADNVSIREYVERIMAEADLRYQQRFDAQQEGLKQALSAAKEAVVKAETSTDERFRNTNEWRQTYDDLASKKLGRDEYESAHKVLEDKIASLEKRINLSEGRDTGISASVATGIAVASFLVALALVLWNILHR
jgi:phosphopantetheinyl transferase (holo-ACP synthase)